MISAPVLTTLGDNLAALPSNLPKPFFISRKKLEKLYFRLSFLSVLYLNYNQNVFHSQDLWPIAFNR